ncbi:MAG: phosphotransferase [Phycisphaerales bacterium JB047]
MASSRQQLSQREIDEVLRHYQIGQVNNIRELPEGSVYSPKVILDTDRGPLLLKRRARGLDMPGLVCFGHEVLLGCLAQGLCVPPLLATKDTGNSMVQHNDHIYELFVFIEGERFNPRQPAHARELGSLLSETHRAMDNIRTTFEPASETETIDLSRLTPLQSAALDLPTGLVEGFTRVMQYGHELAQANARPPAIVHGDWHPGNMIFRGDTLVAVCDFDNTRMGSREREVAQALMHASLVTPTPGQTASQTPAEPSRERLDAFWNGFRQQNGQGHARTIAGLMPATMVDEALASVGPQLGEQHLPLLTAIWRKAQWLDAHQQSLIDLLSA